MITESQNTLQSGVLSFWDCITFGITDVRKRSMEKNKLYVLIDETLNDVYGCVQGGHAVAQYLLEHPNQTWNNSYLIYVKCNLTEWIEKLQHRDKDFSIFYK